MTKPAKSLHNVSSTTLCVLCALGGALGSGCKTYDPLYCAEDKPCTDPALPYCDLLGEYPASDGLAHTCIPDPFGVDAGVEDGSVLDADVGDAPLADAAPPADAAFAELTVGFTGNGSGTVVSDPYGINCNGDAGTSECSAVFEVGVEITLTATPGESSNFLGWDGDSTTAPLVFVFAGATSVEAELALKLRTLTVTTGGDGTGSVTTDPDSEIDCPGDCTEVYDHGTVVALTAAATGAASFGGWSGACSGLDPGACSVTLDGDKNVGAGFDLDQFTLSVSLAGTGGGQVTSSVGTIDCPSGDCADSYPAGTVVTLTASHDATSTFTGWSGGGCTGTGTCGVTVNSATSVTATFTRITYVLNVSKTGTGDGLVSSSPPGINCAPGCTSDDASYNANTLVTLTAQENPTSVFLGWAGAGCGGTSDCVVTMNSGKLVYADFCAPDVCGVNECDSISDGCGSTIDCGGCDDAFDRCGGGGTPNLCFTTNSHSLDLENELDNYAGITDALQESHGGVLDLSGDFTFEMWVYFESLPENPDTRPLISKWKANPGAEMSYEWLYYYVNGKYRFDAIVGQDGTGLTFDSSYWEFIPELSSWYHLVLTCDISQPDTTQFEMFINGVSMGHGVVGTSDYGVTTIHDGTADFRIGGHQSSSYTFDGKIDDVRVWNDVRTPSEISGSSSTELVGNESNLVGYWKFNGNYTDATANGNHLTPNGGPVFSTDIP